MARKEMGFTLMEILVALAVVAISLAAAVRLAGHKVEGTTTLRDKTLTHWVGMNLLMSARINSGQTVAENSGSTAMGGHEWPWEREINETEDSAVKRMEVRVGGEQTLARLTGYILHDDTVKQ
ncbi:MAG: type II secretion system minor pseudopilin GspI [Candidatus Sedimenticola sp. PURPLELP]